MISYEEFKKVELRTASVRSAERVENSEKLVKLTVDDGNTEALRTIVAGIGKVYTLEELIGKEIIIVANLEPKKLMGLESQGMLLAADTAEGPVLLGTAKPVQPGTTIK